MTPDVLFINSIFIHQQSDGTMHVNTYVLRVNVLRKTITYTFLIRNDALLSYIIILLLQLCFLLLRAALEVIYGKKYFK